MDPNPRLPNCLEYTVNIHCTCDCGNPSFASSVIQSLYRVKNAHLISYKNICTGIFFKDRKLQYILMRFQKYVWSSPSSPVTIPPPSSLLGRAKDHKSILHLHKTLQRQMVPMASMFTHVTMTMGCFHSCECGLGISHWHERHVSALLLQIKNRCTHRRWILGCKIVEDISVHATSVTENLCL